jgi:hypothetical protein
MTHGAHFLEPAAAAMAAVTALNFLSVMCCGEAFHRLGVPGVEGLILVLVLYFCLMEEEKRRKEKKASL